MENIVIKSRVISAQQILKLEMKEYPTLVEGIFPMKGVAALAGSSDLGKSYLLQQLCILVASDAKEFIGFKLNIRKPAALYISTEDDDFAMGIRLHNLKKMATDTGLENLKFIFEAHNLLHSIDIELTANPVSLVVIDAFGDVFKGQLNESISVRQFIEPFKIMAQKHECVIIFNHHCGKNNQFKIPSKDNLLGSQGFESSMRTVIELRQDLNDENKRHLCIVKGNNIAPKSKGKSFELIFDFENGFSTTGNRVAFNELAATKNHFTKTGLQDKIFEMKNCGISVREITAKLNSDGVKIGKTKVAELINNKLSETITSDTVDKSKEDNSDKNNQE